MAASVQVVLKGSEIGTETAFHRAIAEALAFPHYYGENLDALWDVMTVDIARPVELIWEESEGSRRAIGRRFDSIVQVLREVEALDRSQGSIDRFVLTLR